ncbi:MAG: 50S ribosomal protein L4 [archaeon]
MKAAVLSMEGKRLKEVELPPVFDTAFHPDLIKRAVLSIQSARRQPKSPNPRAGRNTTAEYVGCRKKPQFRRTINVGRARRPRTKDRRELLYGRVAGISGAVKGPKAHPPQVEKKLKEKINKKEKRKALDSAIAATTRKELVKGRGHRINEGIELPLVVEEKFASLKKTKEVAGVLKKLSLWDDVEKAKEKRKIRAGKGKRRGRKYKRRKSILIVTGKENSVFRAARNIEGIDVVQEKNLNAELLAPGTKAGRLTLWTESAISALGERK